MTSNITALLSHCTTLIHLTQIHAHILRTNFLHLNPTAFHYNALIRLYTRLNAPLSSLRIFISMSRATILPDSYTLPIVLKAATRFFDLNLARQLHCVAKKVGLDFNEYCESGLLSLYCKCGEFLDAYKLFDENPERKLGSWNAILAGLCQGGNAKEAIGIFVEMRKCGFFPDDFTMVSVISACGSLADFGLGVQLHKYVFCALGSEKSDTLMMNSLIDMYGKCGRTDLAWRVFSRMEERNVSSWTSMIVGYAMHGFVDEALEFFGRMRDDGVRPNHVTFVGVLSACVHGGKVQEGRYFFDMMKNVYGIMPQLSHYGCMVDLLGRVGLLQEAGEIVEGMPMEPNVVIWGCLMGACEKFGDAKMGEWVAKHLIELEPWNDGVYVVLSNIYASRGLWPEVERLRVVMKHQKLAKVPAYSLTTGSD